MFNDFLNRLNNFCLETSPVQEIVNELTELKEVQVFVKRDDLIHPLIMGNKWRKLKYNLLESYNEGVDTLLTFGGAFSNHILATASAGNFFGFKTIGVVRGEELNESSNEVLSLVHSLGMRLHFVNRETYKQRHEPDFQRRLRDLFGKVYIIPEGGSNELAIKGIREVLEELPDTYHYYCCSCGTGSTAAGFASGIPHASKLLIFPSLLQIEDQKQLISSYAETKSVVFNTNYIFGGYAKSDESLKEFIHNFPIPVDEVYTGKLFFGLFDLIRKDYFSNGSRILVYHSGGYR